MCAGCAPLYTCGSRPGRLHFIYVTKRVNGLKSQNERLPITRDIVIKLVEQCSSSFNDITMRAAICVAFAGFLRTGEFTYSSWNSSSHEFLFSRGSVQFNKGSVTLTLPQIEIQPLPQD